ncbi:hypothetical protein F5887DRAFT_1188594 [Amanita rubescens]|nr:hypothetical protein F5887DRAFT_1188594 [Amanita rubescens]
MLRNYDAQEKRRKQIRLLNAVPQFRASKYDDTIDIFTELDSNPAKVVALYPESVSGRLGAPASKWVPLFGGPEERWLSVGSSAKAKLQQSNAASIVSLRKGVPDEFHRSIETLVRYLSDQRPKIGTALQAVRITPQNQSHEIAPPKEAAVEELFELPNAP